MKTVCSLLIVAALGMSASQAVAQVIERDALIDKVVTACLDETSEGTDQLDATVGFLDSVWLDCESFSGDTSFSVCVDRLVRVLTARGDALAEAVVVSGRKMTSGARDRLATILSEIDERYRAGCDSPSCGYAAPGVRYAELRAVASFVDKTLLRP